MADGFTRDLTTVDKALTISASRRALKVQELRNAQAAVEEAEAELMACEQVKLMRERHVDMCDREITGLLDERLRAAGAEQETAKV